MNDTSWDKLVDAIDIKFGIGGHGKHTEPLEDNLELTQKVHFIEFTKDGQQYRLTRTSRPAIVDKKSLFHKAAGSGVTYQTVYDPNEITHIVQLYRNAGGDWEPVDTDELGA